MKKLIFLLSIMISFSCANPTENVSAVDADAVVADIVKISNDFQSAYISQDWETASQWISEELGTTIFNSNGSALAVQTEEQVNTDRGWDFGTFEMSNHQMGWQLLNKMEDRPLQEKNNKEKNSGMFGSASYYLHLNANLLQKS